METNKRVLVLGASGMAGHLISSYFNEQGYDVSTLTATKNTNRNNYHCDVFDRERLVKIIETGNFKTIINCIGILNEYAETSKDKAVYLNSYLPHLLSTVTKGTKTKIIQMSTDCVFSGRKGQYKENDFKDGESFYDRTKALGELNNSKDLTFRNSIIGPDINANGIGLFNWFMKQSGDIYGFTGAMWTGVTTLTLAKAMLRAIETDLSGIYNLVNNKPISKFELLELFNKYFKKNQVVVLPHSETKINKSLICTREDFDFEVPSYEQMIKEMHTWIVKHQDLYCNYNQVDRVKL